MTGLEPSLLKSVGTQQDKFYNSVACLILIKTIKTAAGSLCFIHSFGPRAGSDRQHNNLFDITKHELNLANLELDAQAGG